MPQQLVGEHAGLDPLRQFHLVGGGQQRCPGHLVEVAADQIAVVVRLERLEPFVGVHRGPPSSGVARPARLQGVVLVLLQQVKDWYAEVAAGLGRPVDVEELGHDVATR
jgi:hypothetical protein